MHKPALGSLEMWTLFKGLLEVGSWQADLSFPVALSCTVLMPIVTLDRREAWGFTSIVICSYLGWVSLGQGRDEGWRRQNPAWGQ